MRIKRIFQQEGVLPGQSKRLLKMEDPWLSLTKGFLFDQSQAEGVQKWAPSAIKAVVVARKCSNGKDAVDSNTNVVYPVLVGSTGHLMNLWVLRKISGAPHGLSSVHVTFDRQSGCTATVHLNVILVNKIVRH